MKTNLSLALLQSTFFFFLFYPTFISNTARATPSTPTITSISIEYTTGARKSWKIEINPLFVSWRRRGYRGPNHIVANMPTETFASWSTALHKNAILRHPHKDPKPLSHSSYYRFRFTYNNGTQRVRLLLRKTWVKTTSLASSKRWLRKVQRYLRTNPSWTNTARIPRLLKALQHPMPELRTQAIKTSSRIVERLLAGMLNSTKARHKNHFLLKRHHLLRILDAYKKGILGTTKSPLPSYRLMGYTLLHHYIQQSQSISNKKILLKGLNDPDPWVRYTVAMATYKQAPSRASITLAKLLFIGTDTQKKRRLLRKLLEQPKWFLKAGKLAIRGLLAVCQSNPKRTKSHYAKTSMKQIKNTSIRLLQRYYQAQHTSFNEAICTKIP